MDAKSISAMEAIRDDPVLAVNLKAGKMLNVLDSLGYIRIQNLKPSQLLVHPDGTPPPPHMPYKYIYIYMYISLVCCILVPWTCTPDRFL